MSTEDENKDASGFRKLSVSELATAVELYELGKGTVATIAQQLNVSRQTLSKHFKAEGTIKGSRAHEVAQAAGAAVKATVERFAERRAELIEETRISGLAALKQARLIAQKIVVDRLKALLPLGGVDDDLRAAARFNKILIDNLNASLNILRADEHIDEEDLPILTIEDLTNEDILNHHKSTGAIDEDATIEDINLGYD